MLKGFLIMNKMKTLILLFTLSFNALAVDTSNLKLTDIVETTGSDILYLVMDVDQVNQIVILLPMDKSPKYGTDYVTKTFDTLIKVWTLAPPPTPEQLADVEARRPW